MPKSATGMMLVTLFLAGGVAVVQAAGSGPGGPPIHSDLCPCFDEAALNEIPQPYYECVIRAYRLPHYYWTNILHESAEGMSGAQVTVDDVAPYGSTCMYIEFVDGQKIITQASSLSIDTALACEGLLTSHIEQNEDQCLIYLPLR